jgi:RimJ/RimL family protein N-acetyltransferase
MPLLHPLNGEVYSLIRADALPETPERVAELVAACNEPLIYDWLFRERLEGQPYDEAKAASFFAWMQKGWQENEYFVFVLLASSGQLAGVLDIKSATLEGAEVGYWLRAGHKGLMTAALQALEELAEGAGYRSLYARVRPGNERSQAVVRRAGWQNTGLEAAGAHLRFVKPLASD